jgi:hypothetical protein
MPEPSDIVRTIVRRQWECDDSIAVLDACNGRGDFPTPTSPKRLALAVLDLLEDPRTQSRRAEIGRVAARIAVVIE